MNKKAVSRPTRAPGSEPAVRTAMLPLVRGWRVRAYATGDSMRCHMKEARWTAVVSLVLLGQLAVFSGTAAAQSDACRVGQELSPGDYCTVDIPNVSAGTNRFEVGSDGRGCYGGICSGNAMSLNGFEASRIAGTSRWRIDALPGGGTTNQPPRATGSVPAQTLTVGGGSASVNVARYFTDPDGDRLTYTAGSSRSGVVRASLSGSTVTLSPVSAGTATVTVTARDPDGASATQAVAVTVRSSSTETSDRATLEAFYDATGGENWTDSTNWKTAAPLDEWHGVTTDGAGRVTSLDLRSNGLSGFIPPELGDLGFLRRLHLGGVSGARNELRGTVPGELGNLANLERLNLFLNELTGPIPRELGKLANLRSVDLGGNEFTGPIPEELGGLANLEGLTLGGNLTGPIPDELGRLRNLRSLGLGGNELTGQIPRALGSLANLEYLSLGGNNLSGPIPAWLGTLANLTSLHLYDNPLGGAIPAELGNLENLWWLNLGETEVTGSIPPAFGRLVNLERLNLERNALNGPLPAELGNLLNLKDLRLHNNALSGPLPAELGNLVNLEELYLDDNALSGPIPVELSGFRNLERLRLSYNWGLAGPLPAGLEQSRLEELNVFVTQACAPPAWRDWLETIEFYGALCEARTDPTIDVAVVYTPGARETAGGVAAIEAAIDLMVAETNEAYAASGVGQRVALVGRSEVPYSETYGWGDLRRLSDPSDGHLDEAHALRGRTGADLVHLIVSDRYGVCGIANLPGAFGVTAVDCGGITFAHELGHNMGLRHDRFQVQLLEDRVGSHPAYGYVNQRVFDPVAPESSHWTTIMSYQRHCRLADVTCSMLPRFSNPRQRYSGDSLGVPFGTGSGVSGPSDAVAVLEAMGPAVAAWRDRPDDAANRPPAAVGTLPDRRLRAVGATLDVDLSRAFADPDGDSLTYSAASVAPWVLQAGAAGSVVTLTAVSEGTTTIWVTATDPGGLSVSQLFSATVEGAADRDPQGSVESDRAALEALYDATGGPIGRTARVGGHRRRWASGTA